MNSLAYTKIDGKYYKDNPEAQRRRNPRTNFVSRMVYKDAGGYESFYNLPKSERLRLRAIAAEKYWALRTTPTKGMARPDLPKIYKEDKLPKPIPTKSDEVKEGYVYIFQDMMKPMGFESDTGLYKIGSTDDVGSRLSNARTWGAFECIYWFHSHDCRLLEKDVHDVLSAHKVSKTNMGDEWFLVSKDIAINTIHSSIHGTQ